MDMQITLPQAVSDSIQAMVQQSLKDSIDKMQGDSNAPEWFDLKGASDYLKVSLGTLAKFQRLGLQVTKIDGVQRISKKNLNSFMLDHQI